MLVRRQAYLSVAIALILALVLAAGVAAAEDVATLILRQTSELRQLASDAPVAVSFVSRDELREMNAEAYGDPAVAEQLRASQLLLKALGMIEPDTDLRTLVPEIMTDQVAGFYRPKDKRLYVVSGRPEYGPMERATLAHELTHALQDQHFDLETLLASTAENDDQEMALRALVEGDATVTMMLYVTRHFTSAELDEVLAGSNGGDEDSLARAPLVLQRELLFPYLSGAQFVLHLLRGGWSAVNDAYAAPPSSSSEILHPELYDAGWKPVTVELPDGAAALGEEWRVVRRNVLGELDLSIMVEQFLGEEPGAAAAAGWAGDGYLLLEDGAGRVAVLLHTTWQDEAEAAEFYDAYGSLVEARYGEEAALVDEGASWLIWSTPDGAIVLERAGADVRVTIGPDFETTTALASS